MEMLKLLVLVLACVLAAALAAEDVSAYHYDYGHGAYYGYSSGLPIYATGYYYGTYTYGFSGWDYNRVYYRYHQPYYTAWHRSPYYGVAAYPRPFLYRVAYPAVAYPFPGYYW